MAKIMNLISFYFHFNSSRWLRGTAGWGPGCCCSDVTWCSEGGARGAVLAPDKGQHPAPVHVGTWLICPNAGGTVSIYGARARQLAYLQCAMPSTPPRQKHGKWPRSELSGGPTGPLPPHSVMCGLGLEE